MSSELGCYDMDLLQSQERVLRSRLQDYVPERVAEGIERGGNVELGDTEISILFVEMRGYSTISSSLSDDEVFTLTNGYTGAVSGENLTRGGGVVEFQGDGLMAVFGAPSPLDGKESCDVAAALESFQVIASDRLTSLGHGKLSVGVGIATGNAFVGTIQSGGQEVWSAIGSNVNLAARLEGLTKDFSASVVIDETTYRRLESGQSDFCLGEAVFVKRRESPINVYMLPLAA